MTQETTTEPGSGAQHGYTPEKQAYLRRLRLIEGQARGTSCSAHVQMEVQAALAASSIVAVEAGGVGTGIGNREIASCSGSGPSGCRTLVIPAPACVAGDGHVAPAAAGDIGGET